MIIKTFQSTHWSLDALVCLSTSEIDSLFVDVRVERICQKSSLAHVGCDNIFNIDERNLRFSLSVCLVGKYSFIQNMIKGYITEHDRIIVRTNHFVHNKDTHKQTDRQTDGHLWEHDRRDSDRSRFYLISIDINRTGKVRSNTTT